MYLTTPLNPRRLHTIACRTFSCRLASAEENNIIISIIKKVLSGYPHEWSGFHTKTEIQGGSISWRRHLLLFVRLNAVLQSSYDLLNNHKVLIVIETFLFTSLMFFVEY